MSGVSSCQELPPLRYSAAHSWGHLVKLLKTRKYEAQGKGPSRQRGSLKSVLFLDDSAAMAPIGEMILEGRLEEAALEVVSALLLPVWVAIRELLAVTGSAKMEALLPVAHQLWPYYTNEVNVRRNTINLMSVFVAAGLVERTNKMGRGGSVWVLR